MFHFVYFEATMMLRFGFYSPLMDHGPPFLVPLLLPTLPTPKMSCQVFIYW